MKIALVHYHLKTGGVTTVLKQQIAALRDICDLLVLTGDRAAVELPCAVVEIPGLGYDRPGDVPLLPDRIAEQALQALSRKWPDGCDVLHIHNPTLAKNRQFPSILNRLQQSGIDLFLQIHDFAEDGRPAVYSEEAYPANCHYGVINTRDAALLEASGLVGDGVHYLPNAVQGFSVNGHRGSKRHVLYPVRAIRRKNLGEAILLSLFFSGSQRLMVTQPPNSPADAASYHDWVFWVKKNRLPIEFEGGRATTYSTLLSASESMITTSITEGFGMAFLEPWTVGKWLWGRRLPDICADFEARGIRLGSLYDRLDVPLNWIDADNFYLSWQDAVFGAANRYSHEVTADATKHAFARLIGGGKIDFGMLSEKYQRQVLMRLVDHPSSKVELVGLNPWLSNPLKLSDASVIIENNRRVVLDYYGLDRYRNRLLEIYERVVSHPVEHRIDKRILSSAFFKLDRFSLLKWGVYEA